MGSIEKLLIYDTTRSRTAAHVFIAHPSPAEDRALGQLGFVAELGTNERVFQELLSRLQDFLKAAYYTSPEMHADVAFEHTVQACNRYMSELAADFGTAWIDQLSMVLFTVREQEVHFTDVGHLIGFLVHEKHVVDLLGSQRASSRKVNPMKIFTSIASGALHGSDAIFFSTANLMDYFSVEKVRRTIADAPLGGSARQLETVLRADPAHNAFAAVILQRHERLIADVQAEPVRQLNIPGAPQRSMESMLTQSAQTQELLTPSLWPAVKRWAGSFSRAARIRFRAIILRKPTRVSPVFEHPEAPLEVDRPRAGVVLQSPARRLPPSGQSKRLIAAIPNFLWERSQRAIRATPKLMTALGRLAHRVRRAPQQLPETLEQRVADVRGLPQRSKILFYGTVTVAIVFAITLIAIGVQRNHSAKVKAQQQQLTAIQQAIDQAKSSIIYGDEDHARNLLHDAQQKISALPTTTDKAKRTQLDQAIQSVLEQTRHAVTTNPITLGTLPDGTLGVGLTLLGKNLYVADSKTNVLYAMSVTDGKTKSVTTFPGDIGLQELTNFGSGAVVSLAANYDIIEQRTAGGTATRAKLTLPSTNPNLVGLTSYNAALYTVDVANNAILRAVKAGADFSALAWLKQAEALDQAVDLAVDGSLYVLLKSGEVRKFTQGRRVQLALSTIDPPLANGRKILGDTTVQNLYILDPAEKRIAVFTKTGTFVNQYVNDAYANVTSFAVDERGQKLYLLKGLEVQSVPLVKTK